MYTKAEDIKDLTNYELFEYWVLLRLSKTTSQRMWACQAVDEILWKLQEEFSAKCVFPGLFRGHLNLGIFYINL